MRIIIRRRSDITLIFLHSIYWHIFHFISHEMGRNPYDSCPFPVFHFRRISPAPGVGHDTGRLFQTSQHRISAFRKTPCSPASQWEAVAGGHVPKSARSGSIPASWSMHFSRSAQKFSPLYTADPDGVLQPLNLSQDTIKNLNINYQSVLCTNIATPSLT